MTFVFKIYGEEFESETNCEMLVYFSNLKNIVNFTIKRYLDDGKIAFSNKIKKDFYPAADSFSYLILDSEKEYCAFLKKIDQVFTCLHKSFYTNGCHNEYITYEKVFNNKIIIGLHNDNAHLSPEQISINNLGKLENSIGAAMKCQIRHFTLKEAKSFIDFEKHVLGG